MMRPSFQDLLTGQGNYIARFMEAIQAFNSFEYHEELYVQNDGCAIGTRAAPTYCGNCDRKNSSNSSSISSSSSKKLITEATLSKDKATKKQKKTGTSQFLWIQNQ